MGGGGEKRTAHKITKGTDQSRMWGEDQKGDAEGFHDTFMGKKRKIPR